MSSNNTMSLQMTASPSFDLSTFGCNDYDHLNGLVLLFNVEHNVQILVPRSVLYNLFLEKLQMKVQENWYQCHMNTQRS